MTEQLKEKAPIILEEIKKANRILLHLHVNPDEDSVGSALAMMHALKSMGKEADVIRGDSKLYRGYKDLPGADKILEQNFFETDLSAYDLFIILDTGGLEQLSKLGEISFPDSLGTIVIDHHVSNTGYAKTNLIEDTYPATCHIVYDLFREWKIVITKEIASLLYLGIYGDTRGGRHSNTSKESLLAMSELMGFAPDVWNLLNKVENSKSPKTLELKGLALNSIDVFFDGKVPIAMISFEELSKRGITKEDFASGTSIGNELISVLEWEMSFVLIEVFPGHTSLGLRSKNQEKFDVSKIAKILGGGGHKAAAGASIKAPAEEAQKTLIEAIKKAYPELGSE